MQSPTKQRKLIGLSGASPPSKYWAVIPSVLLYLTALLPITVVSMLSVKEVYVDDIAATSQSSLEGGGVIGSMQALTAMSSVLTERDIKSLGRRNSIE